MLKRIAKSILVIIAIFVISLTVHAQENILIYAGPGAGPQSLMNTIAFIKSVVSTKYHVKTVGPDDLIRTDWMHNTALLIMPGGADRHYMEKLSGRGNENIKRYVAAGGKYIGICAGAYYAADHIEFAKGDAALEVTGERELKFFPGLVQGPIYPGFDHRQVVNTAGIRAATINWQSAPFTAKQEFTVYYNGGGYFMDAEKAPNVTVLARYVPELPTLSNQPAAVVECTIGSGKAILSGVHFEWDPATITAKDQRLLSIKNTLINSNADRLSLAKHLLHRLEIENI